VHVFTATTQSDYHLRNNHLLDPAANAHVCNNPAKFCDLRPATEDDFLFAGNTVIPINGFGKVDIAVKTPNGRRKMTLFETALVPSFHTSFVSMRKLKAKEVYWDMEHDRLMKNGKTLCVMGDHYDQWTLEFNEPADPAADPAAGKRPFT